MRNLLFQFVIFTGLVAAFAYVTDAQNKGRTQAAASRSITVTTEPSAVVWLDGVRYGTTDQAGKFTIKSISPGKHTVSVRADGFKETSKAILLTQKGTIQIPLAKTTDAAELAYQEAERLSAIDREKAAVAYRNAVKLNPAFPEAYIGLARVLSDAGDLEAAEKAITEAIRLRPRDAEAGAVEGRIHKQSGEEAKAVAAFKRAIANGGGFQPEAYTGLGMIFQERAEAASGDGDFAAESKNYSEAAKYFAIAVKQLGTAPDAPVIMQLLGLVYEKQNKYKEAIALYVEFLRLFPDSVEASAVRSFIIQLRKQMNELK